MKYKTLIAVMAIGFAASLSTAALSSDYQFHVRCNEAYRASQLPNQGCSFHRINYDHIKAGGLKLMCWHDVHCSDGKPFLGAGYRKGLIWVEDLRKLRRCKADPSKLDTSCAPLEYPHYASCSDEFTLSLATKTCDLRWGRPDGSDCLLATSCRKWNLQYHGNIWRYPHSQVRNLENCDGRLRLGCL